MEAALQTLRGCPDETPLVAFVGHISRSWRVDADLIRVVLEILTECRPFQVVLGSSVGFDLHVMESAEIFGVPVVEVGAPVDEQLRKEYRRPVYMLDGACLVLAFPPQGMKPEHADEDVIPAARKFGIPVVAVTREGECTLWE